MFKLNPTRKTQLIAATIAALPLAGAAYAAGYGYDGEGPMWGKGRHLGQERCDGERRHGEHMGAIGHRGDGPGMAGHADGWIAFVKAELAITDSQEPQWKAVERVLREGMAERGQRKSEMHDLRAGADDTAMPDRLATRIAMMESHLARMKEMQTALGELYGVLTPEQQKSADAVLPRFGPGGGRHMRMR
jgi:Spy/CpxP family protein refolding chaperone